MSRPNGAITVTLMTTDQAAEMLGISSYTLRKWCRARRVTYFKMGREYRFAHQHIMEVLRTQQHPAQSSATLEVHRPALQLVRKAARA